MERVLKNPERYRTGPNYRATNLVFPILFEGQEFIVKQTSLKSDFANAYYFLTDKFFYGERLLSTTESRLEREADRLMKLGGQSTPSLAAYNGHTLIREMLHGHSFRDMAKSEQGRTSLKKEVSDALEAIINIHEKGVVIGDAHIKNFFQDIRKGPCWMDLDGVFDERCPRKSKAIDLLKFVYTSFTETRDSYIALYAADTLKHYPDEAVKDTVKELVTPGLSGLRLWLPVRIDSATNEQVKKRIRQIL